MVTPKSKSRLILCFSNWNNMAAGGLLKNNASNDKQGDWMESKKVVTDVINHWWSKLSALLPFKVRLKNKRDDSSWRNCTLAEGHIELWKTGKSAFLFIEQFATVYLKGLCDM